MRLVADDEAGDGRGRGGVCRGRVGPRPRRRRRGRCGRHQRPLVVEDDPHGKMLRRSCQREAREPLADAPSSARGLGDRRGDERGHEGEPCQRERVRQREERRGDGADAEEGRCDVDCDGGALEGRGDGSREPGEEGRRGGR